MLVVFYTSGHGLGHASRDIELINAIGARRPDARIAVRTAAARWLFDLAARVEVDVEPCETDPGVVQIDSLRLDETATAAGAARFYRDFDRLVDQHARALSAAGASVVVGDVPPLAFAAARRAGIPSIAVANFTWDWIYEGYPLFERAAPGALELMRAAYAQADVSLRLPMHGGFAPMAHVTRDIPFIARRSTRDRAETRRRLGVPGDRPLVLASFGGYGLAIAYERVAAENDVTVVAPARHPPADLRYEDLVAAADLVVSKPGYGIVSECVANDTPLLYTSRGRFVEYDVFVAEMPRVLRCRHIAQDELVTGRWRAAIDALLAQPAPPERPRLDGAAVAADAILATAGGALHESGGSL